jgi:regulator of CtrA degradation
MTDSKDSSAYHDAVKSFAGSKLFFKIFDETIALVQKASDYLEGAGRFDQVRLESKEASVFATESVKMTNRLMHTSSWLLAHRAFFKGDLKSPRDMNLKDYLNMNEIVSLDKLTPSLPTRFVVLVTQSNLLFERILRLDEQLKNIQDLYDHNETKATSATVIHDQFNRIRHEFGG